MSSPTLFAGASVPPVAAARDLAGTSKLGAISQFVQAALRGAALCFGVFVAVNQIASAIDGGVDSNLWWIDLRTWPALPRQLLLVSAALTLITYGLRPKLGSIPKRAALLVMCTLGIWTLRDGVVVMDLMQSGALPKWNLPFSLAVSAFFGSVCIGLLKARKPANEAVLGIWRRLRFWAGLGLGAGLFLVLLPLGVMATFGETDYRSAAQPSEENLAVVFGAGVYEDGTPSLALSDRTLTGIELYIEGHATKLLFSGGPGRGATHETAAMRNMALAAGVPDSAILIDLVGLSTWATAENTTALIGLGDVAPDKLFAVSHGYHLPRIELAFQKHGMDVFTVPATETRPLARRHYFALREVAGFWAYWSWRAIGK
jgi:vancomycin permeability regulator SanA